MKQIFELLEKGFEIDFRRDSYDETFRVTISKKTELTEIVQASFRFSYKVIKQTSFDVIEYEVSGLEKAINREIYKKQLEIRSSQNTS